MGSSSSKPARKLASEAASRVRPSGASSGAANATPAPSSRPTGATSSASAAAAAAANERGSAAGLAQQVGRSVAAAAGTPPQARAGAAPANKSGGSETKDETISKDGKDPQLLQNLAALGAVKVARNRLTYRPTDQMLGILAARQREAVHEDDHAGPSAPTSRTAPASSGASKQIRLSAPTLAQLFDDRKACRSAADLERLAVEYDLDPALIERLAKRFNTPSVGAPVDPEEGEGRRRPDDEREGPKRYHAVWQEPKIVDRKGISA